MKRIILPFVLTLLSSILHSQADLPLLHFQLDAGCGWYVGDFRQHLESDGAWTETPVLNSSLVIYPGSHWGVGVSWGSMMVAHPRSEPMEGIIRYNLLINELRWDWQDYWALLYGGIGYQDAGMTMEWYGSGVGEFGYRFGWEFKPGLSLTLQGGYRFSFFRSIIIAREYSLEERDNLSSFHSSLGLRYEISPRI